jgi:hypothetical protein
VCAQRKVRTETEKRSRPDPRTAFFLCARHVVNLGGASPLRAVMTGTASRSKGVRREAESEGSVRQNSDLTNRNRIEGQRSGVTRQWTGRPNSHPGAAGVNPAGTEGKGHDLPWEVSVAVWASQTTVLATGREGHREVSRGHSSQRRADEGLNPLWQGADGDTRWMWSNSKVRGPR